MKRVIFIVSIFVFVTSLTSQNITERVLGALFCKNTPEYIVNVLKSDYYGMRLENSIESHLEDLNYIFSILPLYEEEYEKNVYEKLFSEEKNNFKEWLDREIFVSEGAYYAYRDSYPDSAIIFDQEESYEHCSQVRSLIDSLISGGEYAWLPEFIEGRSSFLLRAELVAGGILGRVGLSFQSDQIIKKSIMYFEEHNKKYTDDQFDYTEYLSEEAKKIIKKCDLTLEQITFLKKYL